MIRSERKAIAKIEDLFKSGDVLPTYVVDTRIESGEDAVGDPALFIEVVVTDEYASRADFPAQALALSDKIFQRIMGLELDYWPYVRFLSESDLLETPGE